MDRIRARLDTDLKRYIGVSGADKEQIIKPKIEIGGTILLSRLFYSLKEPLVQPFRTPLPLDMIKSQFM